MSIRIITPLNVIIAVLIVLLLSFLFMAYSIDRKRCHMMWDAARTSTDTVLVLRDWACYRFQPKG